MVPYGRVRVQQRQHPPVLGIGERGDHFGGQARRLWLPPRVVPFSLTPLEVQRHF